MIKAIVFDCFGVLYGTSLDRLVAMAPAGRAAEVRDSNTAKDYGYITHEEHLAQVADIIGMPVAEVSTIMDAGHVPNEPLIQEVKRLRQHFKTGLLSNINEHLYNEVFGGRADELFDVAVLSYREGLIKPSPELFQLTIERLGVTPDEAIMIDDLPSNCDGAAVIGMHPILHTNNALTMARIAELTKAQ